MKKTSQPTMKDVAREAGVALGTVSRVFNGFPVGAGYRERVEAAAEKLNYRVNNYARGLKTSKTYCVGLLMPSLRHPFFAVLTDELTACLMHRGYLTHVMITNFDPEAERKSFTLVEQNKVDGIIALTYRELEEIDPSIPVVSIDRSLGKGIPCVSSDNFRGGQLAAEKLIELGCRKLLFLRVGPDIQGEADLRGPGFEDVCQRTHTLYQSLLVDESETEAPIYRYLEEHIRNGSSDFDGIFCNTDGLARRVIAFLREKNLSVPDDVQVIGYDGIIDFATGRYICSTIVQPLRLMAEKAVALLLSPGETSDCLTFRLPVFYAPGGTTKDHSVSVGDQDLYNPFRDTN